MEWLLHFTRATIQNHLEEEMSLLSGFILALATFVTTASIIWIFCNAFNESVLRSAPFILGPFVAYFVYALGNPMFAILAVVFFWLYLMQYALTRWHDNKKPFLLIVGCFVFVIGFQFCLGWVQSWDLHGFGSVVEAFVDKNLIGPR